MIELYKLYKHRNNTDVAIQPVSIAQQDDGTWNLRVLWYNIGKCHKPFCMGLELAQNITIPNDRIPEWEEYNG